MPAPTKKKRQFKLEDLDELDWDSDEEEESEEMAASTVITIRICGLKLSFVSGTGGPQGNGMPRVTWLQ